MYNISANTMQAAEGSEPFILTDSKQTNTHTQLVRSGSRSVYM